MAWYFVLIVVGWCSTNTSASNSQHACGLTSLSTITIPFLIWDLFIWFEKKHKFRNEKVCIGLGTVTTLNSFLPYYVAINKKREREINFDTNNIFGNDTVVAISRKMSLSSAEVRNVLYRQCEVCGGVKFTYSCACTHSSADSPHLKNLEARVVIPVTTLFSLQFNA